MSEGRQLRGHLDRSAAALRERQRRASKGDAAGPIAVAPSGCRRRAGQEGRPRHLGEAERQVLLAAIAAHPGASLGQLRLIFRARTGRMLSASTVQEAKRRGWKDTPGHRHLVDADREVLSRICLGARPHHCRAEIRRRFVVATGREISLTTVSRFAIEVMGLPRLGTGEHAGGFESATARREAGRVKGELPSGLRGPGGGRGPRYPPGTCPG